MRPHAAKLGVCLISVMASQFAFSESDVKLEGRVHVGVDLEKFKNGEPKYDAKLDIETKRKHGFEGRFALRADSDQEIFLQDAYIDKKFDKSNWQMELGKHKKRLGLEWQKSEKDRLSISRSFIYDQLQIFGYAGRESILQFQYAPDESTNEEYSFTLGYNEATDSSAVFHGQTPITDKLYVGGWQLFQWDKIDEKRQLVWATVLSLWTYSQIGNRFEFELFTGIDPFESEFERAFGDGKNVHFYAGKFQYGYGWSLDDEAQETLMPFLHAGYYVYDADSPDFNTVEGILGLNYYFEHMQLASEIALIGTNSKLKPSERNYDESEARVEVTVYF